MRSMRTWASCSNCNRWEFWKPVISFKVIFVPLVELIWKQQDHFAIVSGSRKIRRTPGVSCTLSHNSCWNMCVISPSRCTDLTEWHLAVGENIRFDLAWEEGGSRNGDLFRERKNKGREEAWKRKKGEREEGRLSFYETDKFLLSRLVIPYDFRFSRSVICSVLRLYCSHACCCTHLSDRLVLMNGC